VHDGGERGLEGVVEGEHVPAAVARGRLVELDADPSEPRNAG
jgi:hypothetical protein